MIDLIANTKPMAGHCGPSHHPPYAVLCICTESRAHDGAALAAMAVSFGTMLVCR
jgi:hypothetical protein